MIHLPKHFEQVEFDHTKAHSEVSNNALDSIINENKNSDDSSALQTGKFKLRAAGYFLTANAVFRRKWIESLGPNDEVPPPLSVTMYDFMATPRTLLPDYTREKKIPEMSPDMKNVLKLYLQEFEAANVVNKTNCGHMISEGTDTISDIGDKNEKPENDGVTKAPAFSDFSKDHTSKKYQLNKRISKQSWSFAYKNTTIPSQRNAVLAKISCAPKVDLISPSTHVPKVVKVSSRTESLLHRKKCFTKPH